MKKKLKIKTALLLFGFIPTLLIGAILSVVSISTVASKVEQGEYEKLDAASTSVAQYFESDIAKDNVEKSDIQYEFIDSLEGLEIEQTLFKGNERYITSIKDDMGTRDEGSTASDKVWQIVSNGESYRSNGVEIGGQKYYVAYKPIYSDDKLWGMAFAGIPEKFVKEAERSAAMSLIVVVLIALTVVGAATMYIAKLFYKPMMSSADALNVLASGDIGKSISIKSNFKELDDIINSASKLQKQLHSIVGEAQSIATDLGEAVSTVDSLTASSADGTNQISQAVNELAATAQSMAETVQDANTYILEMGNAIDSITDSIEVMSKHSDESNIANKDANAYLNNLKEANEHSVDAMNDISARILECNKAAEHIKRATDAISEIAGQTNLLSLNASIEAARAGEAGKGFAVVADNIKSLAEQSARSATEIQGVINEIVSKVNACVNSANEMSEITEHQTELLNDTVMKIDIMSQKGEGLTSGVFAIKDEVETLNKKKESVLNNISDLSAISEENAASSEEVTASVENIAAAVESTKDESATMKTYADHLKEKMEFFKL